MSEALFGDDEDACEAALTWLERTNRATAVDVAKAVERACREDRYDLIRALAALLRPYLPDLFKRRDARSPQKSLLVATLLRQDAPGVNDALSSLGELACEVDALVRKNFCLAAGELWAGRYLPLLIRLLDDTEEEVRYEAAGALYAMVHADFGYDSEAPAEQRAVAVERWWQWLAEHKDGGFLPT